MNNKLCKIVYFDEESVADYVQILDGGELEKTTELLTDIKDNANGGAQIKGNIGISKLLKALIGSDLEIKADASVDARYSNERIAKNIIKNTLLTDFISIIEKEGENDKSPIIHRFSGYKISAPKDSLSYVSLISPYLSMIRGGNISSGDFNIALEKIDNTIKSAKGYYEYIGENNAKCDSNSSERIIFRFNIQSFKNNYKPNDLLKMNITVFAIKVGKSTISKLDLSSEFNIASVTQDNPSYTESDSASKEDDDTELDVYDVLLAGVEAL